MLWGRQEEERLLAATRARVRDGRSAVLLLRGGAGLGKTALADAAAEDAARDGFLVLRGAAWSEAETPPFFLLMPGLRALGVAPLPAPPSKQREDGPGEAAWYPLAESLLAALARATTTQPVFWILEDLQGADRGSLACLTFLVETLRSLPVGLLLTTRPSSPDVTHERGRLSMRLFRAAALHDLGPLSPAAAAGLLHDVAGGRLTNAARAALVARADGNPFFLRELGGALRAGRLDTEAAIPPTVEAVVSGLLDALPADTRAWVEGAAVAGRSVRAQLLAEAAGSLAARVIDDLRPALRAGLFREEGPGSYAWRENLTREAVYASLKAGARLGWHQSLDRALSHSQATDTETKVARARHALAACEGREKEVAAATMDAARAVAAQGAHVQACELGVQALPLFGVDASRPSLEVARWAWLAGRPHEARRLSLFAAQEARARGDALGLAAAVWELGAELRPAIVSPELVHGLEEALAALPSPREGAAEIDASVHGWRCRLMARLAAARQPAADPQGPVALARQALAACAGLDDELRSDVLFYAGSALTDFAPPLERSHAAEELKTLCLRTGDRRRLLIAYARLLMELAEADAFDAFDANLGEMVALARAAGHPRQTWRALLFSSMRALARGDFVASERLLVEVEELAGISDDGPLALSLLAHRHHAARMAYDPVRLRASGEALFGMVEDVPYGELIGRLMAAGAFAWLGEVEACRRVLESVALDERLTRSDLIVRLAGEAVACAGTPAQARWVREQLARYPSPAFVGGHVPMSYDGPTSRLRGLLARRAGELEEADELLAQAATAVARNGFLPWMARLAFERSEVLATLGRAPEARALAEEAQRAATSLGLAGLQEMIGRSLVFATGEARDHQTPTGASAAPTAGDVADVTEPLTTQTSARPTLAFSRAGDLWTFTFAACTVHLKDNRGLSLLGRLLERPDEEIHVLALSADDGEGLADTDAGEALDSTAAAQYRARLRQLDAELAGELADDARRHREQERAALTRELSAGVGLKGPRRAASASERARINVQRRLKDAVKRIGLVHPSLGQYLARAVRTGTFCTFRP